LNQKLSQSDLIVANTPEGILQGGLTPKAFPLPKLNDDTLHYPTLKPHEVECDPNNVQ